ncbi:helix-turn-helix domain-containing protein [Bernardetia sp.]|uniref:AlbA family DNA-binding domain-containing protein n=1 Tax=Bernardetia sp. TaxID=1937974 RepID=UPI0025C3A633|nr:ATP-binding protein [Bernardetia sp.]
MRYKDLKNLVAEGEGLHIEFKRKVYYPQKILREVVAFVNTEGGKLCIGVSDNGEIPGLKYPDEAIYMMEKAMEDFCKPLVTYDIYRVHVPYTNGCEVVVFDFKPHPKRPVYLLYKKNTRVGKAYVRIADKSAQASKEMRKIIKARANEKDVLLQYGQHERTLLQYLGSHKHINLEEYADLVNISQDEASAILVNLTVANIIEVKPQEGGYDFFVHGRTGFKA